MLQYLFLFIKQGSKMVIQAAKSILKNVYYTSHTNTLQLSDQSSPSRAGTPHIDIPNLTTDRNVPAQDRNVTYRTGP